MQESCIMKKSIISLAVAAGLVASMSAAHAGDVKVKWFGFGQITASQLDQNAPNDGVAFGADRVRIGFKVKDGNVFGKLQVDFNETDKSAATGSLDKIIKDIVVGYKFSNAASIKTGQFKTPVGMDFNVSGKKLDITKRGMEKKLVMERTAGIMLSGRKIANGIGYDLFYGNPAGRGSASAGGTTGDANSMAARVSYDMGKMMHVELSYGVDETSSTAVTADDYEVIDLAFRMKMAAMTIKFEYIDGSSVAGVKNADETVWYAHLGYNVNKTTELVVRHYQADQDRAVVTGTQDASASLTNTYLGANFFLGSNKTNGRVQVNYVIVGGDDKGSTNAYNGAAKGYTDDAILAQYQVSF